MDEDRSPSIEDVIEALQRAAWLRSEVERESRDPRNAYEFGYHFSREIDAARVAAKLAGDLLDGYIDARIRAALPAPPPERGDG